MLYIQCDKFCYLLIYYLSLLIKFPSHRVAKSMNYCKNIKMPCLEREGALSRCPVQQYLHESKFMEYLLQVKLPLKKLNLIYSIKFISYNEYYLQPQTFCEKNFTRLQVSSPFHSKENSDKFQTHFTITKICFTKSMKKSFKIPSTLLPFQHIQI